jgi:hypothetical protein
MRRLLFCLLWVPALISAPVWFPLFFLAVAFELIFLPGEWQLRSEMRRASRLLSKGELDRHLLHGSGTLIVEFPTVGWSFSRAWWTEDDLRDRVPAPSETDVILDEFSRRCYETYFERDHGRAQLVSVWRGERVVRRLKKRFPDMPVVTCHRYLV